MASVVFPVDVDTKAFTKAMIIINKKALPDAIAETLNRTADATTKQQIRNVKKDVKVRTKFTLKSMESRRARPWKALNKARGKNISRMFSRAGTFSNYLWKQEESATYKGMNGPVPIPVLRSRTSKNINKSVRKKYRLSPGQDLSDKNLGNNMFIGTPQGRKRGIYEKDKRGKLFMIRNLESQEIRIKGTGFHSKAVKKFGTTQFIKAQYQKVFKRAMRIRGVA